MKKMLGMVMVLGLVLVFSGVAMAGGTSTVTVTANVVGTCGFDTANATLAFGALDPSIGGPVNGSALVNLWCTNGQGYTITDNDGTNPAGTTHQMDNTGTPGNYIAYTFNYAATGTGTGRTVLIPLAISGTVAFAAYQNALVGDYSDTVVLTITP